MRLLNFPYLVQAEILEQMAYDELIFLSFTSKRATKIIASFGRKEISAISYQMISDHRKGSVINVLVRQTTGEEVGVFCIYKKLYGLKKDVVEIELNEDLFCGVIQHNEPSELPHLVLQSDQFISDPVVEAIHNQIDQLFGRNISYELVNDGDGGQSIFLPSFIKINKLRLSRSGRVKLRGQDLDSYLLEQPKLNSICYREDLIIGLLNPNSKIFETDHLEVVCCGLRKPAIADPLSNFRGQKLDLYTDMSCYTKEEIIEFLKKWKTKENYRNLKTLRTDKVDSRIAQEGGLKRLPKSKNPPLYCPILRNTYNYFDNRVRYQQVPKRPFYHYIVREDGIVAYVAVSEEGLCFEVQEFTEQEMLSKF